MHGHEHLVKLRMAGKAMSVSIGTDHEQSRWLSSNWPRVGMSQAHVSIAPEERLVDLDLRFLVKLMVHIDGTDEKRVVEVFEACKKAGALRVVGTVFRRLGDEFRTVRLLDSEELMTWPA